MIRLHEKPGTKIKNRLDKVTPIRSRGWTRSGTRLQVMDIDEKVKILVLSRWTPPGPRLWARPHRKEYAIHDTNRR